jgi:hypothetical protein
VKSDGSLGSGQASFFLAALIVLACAGPSLAACATCADSSTPPPPPAPAVSQVDRATGKLVSKPNRPNLPRLGGAARWLRAHAEGGLLYDGGAPEP